MSAVSQAAPLEPQVALRSLLRRDRHTVVPCVERQRRERHWSSILRLVGHLAATAFFFVSLITLTWIVSWAFSSMHSVHPFPDDTFQLFANLKIVLIYLDVLVSGIVLLAGVWHYILDVLKGDS
jgi:hypothetical protein